MKPKYIELELEIIFRTDIAMLVCDGDNEVWIPYSLCRTEYDGDVFKETYETGQVYAIRIAEWKARDVGLI